MSKSRFCLPLPTPHLGRVAQDKLWGALFEDAESRGCMISAHTPIRTWFEAAVKLPVNLPNKDVAEREDDHDDDTKNKDAPAVNEPPPSKRQRKRG